MKYRVETLDATQTVLRIFQSNFLRDGPHLSIWSYGVQMLLDANCFYLDHVCSYHNLQVSIQLLHNILRDQDNGVLSCSTIYHLVGEICYGGKITDTEDMNALRALLRKYCSQQVCIPIVGGVIAWEYGGKQTIKQHFRSHSILDTPPPTPTHLH